MPDVFELFSSRIISLAAVIVAAAMGPLCQAQVQGVQGSVYEPVLPAQSNEFARPADSIRTPSVPEGQTFTFRMDHSEIFPGTTRTINVYIPAAYRGDKPACVYVGLDALSFNAATVFDNLIADGSIPVTIGVGISPGVVASGRQPQNPRFDRSLEFDTLDDRLAHFILEEVLPQVQHHRTPKDLPILLSSSPDDRAIGGASTGGVAAFNVAWQRPESFHRVFTAIGTFVGMRGGERLYVQVRKTEPKPIRVFMQDGAYDQWPGGQQMGDWWMSNQTMQRALSFAGYDVNHVWGSGTHSNSHADSIFPEAMRWLWHDWPTPVRSGHPGNERLLEIVDAHQPWKLIAEPCKDLTTFPAAASSPHLAANDQGQIFSLGRNSLLIPLTGKSDSAACVPTESGPALEFDGHNNLYRTRRSGGIAIEPQPRSNLLSAHQHPRVIGQQLRVHDFLVRSNGDVYALTQLAAGSQSSAIWLIPHSGTPIKLDDGFEEAAGLAFSPDGQWLIATRANSHLALSYQVLPNGTVGARAAFYDIETSPAADDPGVGNVVTDIEGRAYIATRLGVQVMDRNGRVIAIMPLPGGVPAESLCFGREDGAGSFNVLYVLGQHRLFARRLRVKGLPPAFTPMIEAVGGPG